MKKLFVLLMVALSVLSTSAQGGFKGFISDMTIDLSVGLSWARCNKVFADQKLGFTAGLDFTKPITTFHGSPSTLYGLLGFQVVQKGGKITDNALDGRDMLSTHIAIPLHVGYRYSFSKCSLFVHAGPYVSFKAGEGEMNDRALKSLASTEFGLSGDIGIKFRRFQLSYGLDFGLTKVGTGIDGNDNLVNMKSNTGHVKLTWSFGKGR